MLSRTQALATAARAGPLTSQYTRPLESTAGEVPATLRTTRRGKRSPMGRPVVVSLWGNGAVRVLTGFLTLFVAFVVKTQTEGNPDPTRQLLLIGIIGASAGVGAFAGNAVGSRQRFTRGNASRRAGDTVVATCLRSRSLISDSSEPTAN